MASPVAISVAPAGRASCELADIFGQYGAAYTRTHRLRPAQRKAIWAITHCRTAALGGQHRWCEACGFERFTYHSCRNRHCPKCQSAASAAWAVARQEDLLPVPYFHNVFTLPHDLNPLILYSERNQRALLKLLFGAAASTLLTFGYQELGGQIGFTLVLHTWDQRLQAHFHLHGLIAAGALSNDGTRWVAGGRRFLFSVRGLSKMFRGKYLDGLATLLEAGDLDVPPQLSHLRETIARRRWLQQLRKSSWVVYTKAPFAGPRKLIDYLSRYTHRVAVSNHRLLDCKNGQVRYTFRDRRDGDRQKTDELPVAEFLHRFLQHVLPDGFCRVRHYGLLANGIKRQRLEQCRRLLGVQITVTEPTPTTAAQWLQTWLGIDVTQCPQCGGPLHCQTFDAVRVSSFPMSLPPRGSDVTIADTS
ncbi:MAG: IS91 family transposase [Pirellulales bacterium]